MNNSLNKTRNLKMLQTMHYDMEAEEKLLNYQIKKLERERDKKRQKRVQLAEKLSPKDLVVSEHAILRYLERIEGMDMDRVRKILLDRQIIDCHKKLGNNGEYPSLDSTFKVKIKNNVITTVIP
jgi:hypothetical protein